MKQVKLNVQAREATGSGSSRRLRQAGQIPAVLYGESGTRHLSIARIEFRNLWKEVGHVTALVEVTQDGADAMFSVIKDAQRDPLTGEFVHIDFREVQRGKPMEAEVAVRVVGEADGVRNQGGVLEQHLHEVEVRCRPRDLPEFIRADVTNLRVGDSLHVRELPALEGVTYLSDPDLVVAAVAGATIAKSDEETEEDEEA